MNILLATIGSAGDVHPMLGIGLALQRRGHAVTLLTNGYFEGLIRRAGLEFVSIGHADDYLATVRHPDFFHKELPSLKLLADKMVGPAVRPLYTAIAERYVPGETVVAGSSFAYGARIAQEKLGVPVATVHYQPTMLRGFGDLPSIPAVATPLLRGLLPVADRFTDRMFSGPVNALRAELGLAPARGLLGPWMHSPLRVIGLFPEWYAAPQPEWPSQTRLTGFPLYDAGGPEEAPEEVEEFLQAGDPPILFTAGTAMHHGQAYFAASVEACRRIGRRGLLLTRDAGAIPGDLPEGLRHVSYAPFSQVLPRCAAAVHHGGIGTLSQCLAAGVPQLVVPFAFDQPDGAARIRRLGVGDSLPPGDYRAEKIAPVLERLLSSGEVRARCQEVAARFRGGDPLGETCRLIEALGRK